MAYVARHGDVHMPRPSAPSAAAAAAAAAVAIPRILLHLLFAVVMAFIIQLLNKYLISNAHSQDNVCISNGIFLLAADCDSTWRRQEAQEARILRQT